MPMHDLATTFRPANARNSASNDCSHRDEPIDNGSAWRIDSGTVASISSSSEVYPRC